MEDPKWLTRELVLAIHARQIAEHGGDVGVRDVGLLESALARPQQLLSYGSPPPDLFGLASAYAFGIAKNYPFLDGNKRTAFVAYRLFLRWNGFDLSATREDRYLQMLALAAGEHTEESFAEWLRSVAIPATGP